MIKIALKLKIHGLLIGDMMDIFILKEDKILVVFGILMLFQFDDKNFIHLTNNINFLIFHVIFIKIMDFYVQLMN